MNLVVFIQIVKLDGFSYVLAHLVLEPKKMHFLSCNNLKDGPIGT